MNATKTASPPCQPRISQRDFVIQPSVDATKTPLLTEQGRAPGGDLNTDACRKSSISPRLPPRPFPFQSPLFLDIRMGEQFLRPLVVEAVAINVMGDLVNQNAVEVEITQIIAGETRAETKRMRAEENARTPINAIAADTTVPRFLLLASSGQQEDRSQTFQRTSRHAFKSCCYFGPCADVDEVSKLRSQRNDVRERWIAWDVCIKSFERGLSLCKEWVIKSPIGEFGPAVSVASRPGRLEVRAQLWLQVRRVSFHRGVNRQLDSNPSASPRMDDTKPANENTPISIFSILDRPLASSSAPSPRLSDAAR